MLLKKKKVQSEPEEGDYRVELRFAWWPVRSDDGLIWLEKYKRIYEWTVRPRSWFIGGHYLGPLTCGGWDLKATKRLSNRK